jgi:hypothetical protein
MKIFSLQSKIGVAVWSVISGAVLNAVSLKYYLVKILPDCANLTQLDRSLICSPPLPLYYSGFPFHFNQIYDKGSGIILYLNGLADLFASNKFWLNLFFWIIVVLIILSLIRYFKTKKA